MATKLQRWIDVLAALLRRSYPVSFEELAREVPAYQVPGQSFESRRRMFERDKDELRSFGIPISTRPVEEGQLGYQLRRQDFYLPYLTVLRDGVRDGPVTPVDKFGYRSLPVLAFEPDELRLLEELGPRLQQLGVPSILDDARSALRKLGAGLPVRPPEPIPGTTIAATFDLLNDGLQRRKHVTFAYRSLSAGTTTPRTVAGYGLFFLGHHWYLAGVEPGSETVKNFRLSRMEAVAVNPARPSTADYAVPESFMLREHARSRQAWELGAADTTEAIVEIVATNGTTRAVRRLGEEVDGHPDRRLFRVRRPDTFVRWVLGFAGQVRLVAPDTMVTECRQLASATLARYGEGAP